MDLVDLLFEPKVRKTEEEKMDDFGKLTLFTP